MKRVSYIAVTAVACFIVGSYVCALIFWTAIGYFNVPSVQRVAFSASKELTEQEAVNLSRRALILDGKHSAGMRPVRYSHDIAPGGESFFARNELDNDSGYVLWWLGRPDQTWEYQVRIKREGDEVVCTISRPL